MKNLVLNQGLVVIKLFCGLLLICATLRLFSQTRPNVVIILADDLDDIVTPQFFPEVLPIVDSMKKIGIDFSNSFTPMSICCPSRAALLSGQYAHKNQVYRNGGEKGGWDDFKPAEPRALPSHLSKGGYRTAMIGKYMNGFERHKKELPPVPYGWTDGAVFVDPLLGTYEGYDYELMLWNGGSPVSDTVWDSPGKRLEIHGRATEDYSTDVLTKEAISFIHRTEENDPQPFFLYLTPTPPHFPLPPAPRHGQLTLERWLQDKIPAQENSYNDFGKLAQEVEKRKPLDKPSWLRKTWKKRVRQRHRGKFYFNATFKGKVPRSIKGFWQANWYHRMGSLYALNDLVREVIAALKQNGEWDNTLLIFTSDNGFQFGYHALQHKGSPYEESIRVPLVIIAGDSLKINSPAKVEEWVVNLDLAPTILELAGIKVPEDMDGQSLKPFLEFGQSSETENFRDRFIMEYIGPGMTTDFIAKHPKLINKILPSYVLDHPTFHAIRMIVSTASGEQIFKYIEWERYPGHFRFRKKLELQDEKLMSKIAEGKKHAVKKKNKMEAIEGELYNLTDDPYEMDNLLYYQPEKYKSLAEKLKTAMQELINQ